MTGVEGGDEVLCSEEDEVGRRDCRKVLRYDFFEQIAPIRIIVLDQIDLPRADPVLDGLFAPDGIGGGLMRLEIDQPFQIVARGKTRNRLGPVFVDARYNLEPAAAR